MGLSVGVDVVELGRLQQAIDRFGDRFLARVYTAEELFYARRRVPELAARFAAKEAVSKALGVGMRHLSAQGIGWHEVEVLSDPRGKPVLRLSGRARELAEELGLCEWAVSLSHERDRALAFVVALGGVEQGFNRT
jgi:holo-[acyl-carrier protein] synthase